MQIISQGLHAGGEFLRIGLEPSAAVTLQRHPAIVHGDKGITGVTIAFGDHGVCGLTYHLLVDAFWTKVVPCIPAHRRSERQHSHKKSFLSALHQRLPLVGVAYCLLHKIDHIFPHQMHQRHVQRVYHGKLADA